MIRLEGVCRAPCSRTWQIAAGAVPILFFACGRTELVSMPAAGTAMSPAGSVVGGDDTPDGDGQSVPSRDWPSAGGIEAAGAEGNHGTGGTGGTEEQRPDADVGSGQEHGLDGTADSCDSGVGNGDDSGPIYDSGPIDDSGPAGDGGTEWTDRPSAGEAGGGIVDTLPDKFVGNIDTSRSIRSDFSTYWNQFTPENAGKWRSVQPSSQDSFQWSSLDAMYKYCEENGVVFKEHTFAWGNQQPNWTSELTPATGPAAVQNWMKAFCDRYPKTRLVDVVNEPPPHTYPPYAEAIGGAGSSGWDWIVNAFVWAHEACPNAILLLNDFSNIEYEADARHTIEIVNTIQKAGAPIHAIGCQTHGALNVPASTLKANIDLIAAQTGLPIYITEYDIDLADDNQQLQQYEEHFPMFWSNDNVRGITLWGYVLGRTWEANSGILRSDGTMRPAMSWLMGFLGR